MKKAPKHKIIFSSTVKPLTTSEKDKYLSLASVEKLRPFIPDINTTKNYDLVPVAFNACVINRANKNDDILTSETAVLVYKDFINKQINIEHNRANIIGVVLTAGFSEFGTDLPMTEEQAAASTKPYNIVLGGVIWRVANYDLAEVIESSDDPTSEHYLKISASWELGFDDWDIAVIDANSKNTEDGVFVSDSAVNTMMENLRCFGGNGRLGEDKKVYRRVKGEGVLPMGIGLTETPAADVKGLVVASENASEPNVDLEAQFLAEFAKLQAEESKQTILAVLKNFSSQTKNEDVKKDSIMKITSVKDITDESLKVVQASAIQDFISEEMKKASEQYTSQKSEHDNAIKLAKEQYASLLSEHETLKASLKTIQDELVKLKNEATAREKQTLFDARMAGFDAGFNLTDDDRKAIAAQIKDLSEEAFTTVQANLTTLLSAKKKGQEVKASATDNKDGQTVVDNAVDNAKKDATTVTTTTKTSEPSLKDKFAKAFGVDGFDIQINNKR